LSQIFSSDEDVIALTANVLPLVCLFLVADSLMQMMLSILLGAGKPRFAVVVAVTGFGLFSAPGAYLLSVTAGMELPGLWIGPTGTAPARTPSTARRAC
jgi:MATE family multidrug resistance protein